METGVGKHLDDWGGYYNTTLDAIDTAIAAKAPSASPTFTGVMSNAVGAAATPAYTFTGHTGYGLYYATNVVGVSVNGSSVGTFASTGFVGNVDGIVGGNTPAAGTFTTLHASGATTLDGAVTIGDASSDAITLNGVLTAGTGATIITVATATGGAGLRLPHGTAPTSPVNGDIWTTSAGGLYVRINGATVGPIGTVSTSTANTWTAGQTFSGGFANGASVKTADYTLAVGDSGKVFVFATNTGLTVTLPPNATAAILIGAWVKIINVTGGTLAVATSGSGTITYVDSLSSPIANSSSIMAMKIGTDLWYVSG